MGDPESKPEKVTVRMFATLPGRKDLGWVADIKCSYPETYSDMLWEMAQEFVRVSGEFEGKEQPRCT